MYPLSVVVPLAQILEALTGQPKIRPSCHPDCAFGTYFLVSPEGKAYPFPQVIDIEGMFTRDEPHRRATSAAAGGRPGWTSWRTIRMFQRHFRQPPPRRD